MRREFSRSERSPIAGFGVQPCCRMRHSGSRIYVKPSIAFSILPPSCSTTRIHGGLENHTSHHLKMSAFTKAAVNQDVATPAPDAKECTTLRFEWTVRGLKNLFDTR